VSLQGLKQIGQIQLSVYDLDRAAAFYRYTLGMHFLFQVPNMAFFDCRGIRLLLAVPEDMAEEHSSSIIYFKVADLENATEALRSQGVTIVAEPAFVAKMPDHDLWMSFFLDSEGNTLSLMAEMR